MSISQISIETAATQQSVRASYTNTTSRAQRNLSPLLFTVVIAIVLAAGWLQQYEGHLTPERGLRYWLGVGGGSAMLLLLLYPLRKRLRVMRFFGSIPTWFKIHMVLGIIGPVLILFHVSFKLGSANSNVALFSMLLVAGSGIAGRYLYGKIHLALYGRKATVDELLAGAETFKDAAGSRMPFARELVETLSTFRNEAMKPKGGVVQSSFALIALAWKARCCWLRLIRNARAILAKAARTRNWSWRAHCQHVKAVRDHIDQFFAATRKAAAFAFCERPFAQRHVLHLPLFPFSS